jgi:hypothetical protein
MPAGMGLVNVAEHQLHDVCEIGHGWGSDDVRVQSVWLFGLCLHRCYGVYAEI